MADTKNIRYLCLCMLYCLYSITGQAHEYRNLLQKQATATALEGLLQPASQWVPYPAYTNRTAWDALTGTYRQQIIAKGQARLDYAWKVVPAMAYIEFEKSGSRQVMEGPMGENQQAFADLLFAELAEGKGRFLPQLVNGIWYFCDVPNWSSSAHLGRQKSRRSLPEPGEHLIDLAGSDMAAVFAWTLYFLQPSLDEIQPAVAKRLRQAMQERILNSFMTDDDMWWQAFKATPTTMVNNWNPWCNFNMLTCFLLLEENPGRRAKAVYRTMVSVDKFINYNHNDGACEEGPSYWGHAAGKLYDYLQLLHLATNGRVSLFGEPIVKNLGEYIARSYVGNGWVVNFADASAKGGGYPGVIFRYGKAVNSPLMIGFAAYLFQQKASDFQVAEGRDMFRSMENLRSLPDLKRATAALPREKHSWYPETEFCYMRMPDGFFFAAKGGYNAESHNHNDAGTFSLYLNETPVLIDAGVGTYTRQTFSHERYSIWTMQSDYHNLPRINGASQPFGREYKAKQTTFLAEKNQFSLDLAGAYDSSAATKSWVRTYTLSGKGELTLQDKFELLQTKAPNA
ncbi:MAG: heparinase II/III-family protein, partial [Chitinophagaceae bacterium]|nr:heparinase II/III-family protein [Chitinophagaceae bacterium]